MYVTRERLACLVGTLVLFASSAVAGSRPAAAPRPITELAPVAVTGVQPGPALWKVVGKDGHVMWVLGTTSPLPAHMEWKTVEVERAIAGSQRVLKAPGLEFGARVGFFGKLFLLPSLFGLKKNPDGGTLQQVLPADVYGRWQAQKAKYLGDDRSVERLRPLFAGKELYAAALEQAGLLEGGTEQAVNALADRYGVGLEDTAYQLIVEDPRAAIKTFKISSMADVSCLEQVIASVDRELAQATVRANAWATGDLDLLRQVLAGPQQDACLAAIGCTGFARKLGVADIPERIEGAWLDAARDALTHHEQSFAVLPMEQVLLPDGYLAHLRAEGYLLEVPQP